MSELDMEKTEIGVVDNTDRTQIVEPIYETTKIAASIECPVCMTNNPPNETYCNDCGFLLSSKPIALSHKDQQFLGMLISTDGVREFILHLGDNTVGRENADIMLVDNTISRKHAKIVVESMKAFVEDLGSSNGTYIDGVKLAVGEKRELNDGNEIVFSTIAFKYVAPKENVDLETEMEKSKDIEDVTTQDDDVDIEIEVENESQETVVEDEVSEMVSEINYKLISKDGSLSFLVKDGVYKVGRREGDNDFVLSDPFVSGRHANIEASDGILTIVDVGSTNGTQVNGVKLEINEKRELCLGDEISLGSVVLKVQEA